MWLDTWFIMDVLGHESVFFSATLISSINIYKYGYSLRYFAHGHRVTSLFGAVTAYVME